MADLHAPPGQTAADRNGAAHHERRADTAASSDAPAAPARVEPARGNGLIQSPFQQSGDSAREIVAALKRAGIDLVCSLPDKWLSAVLKAVDADGSFTHLQVTREEEGLAICAGAYLGGRKGVTICQTAGLLLSVNTLAAHVHQHHFPQLILAAHRGTIEDAFFFQMYKGQVTTAVLDAIPVKYVEVMDPSEVSRVEQAARYADLQRAPVVVLLGKRVLVGRDSFG